MLIDRSFEGSSGLSLLWVLRGWRTPEQVAVRPTPTALPGVDLITGQVERIDLEARTIDLGAAGAIGYDALVIALGANLDIARLPGLADAFDAGVAGQFYTVDGALDLHREVEALESGRVAVLVAAAPFKCPAAPFEAAFLLAVVPPHSPSAAAASTGLGSNGWIPVDPATLATTAPGVFAVGDATALPLPNGKPLPKAAIFAEAEGEVAAHQIARYLGYAAPDSRFTGEGACYVELGDGLAAKGEGNFLAPPTPQVSLREPSAAYHEEKQRLARDWLARWNIRS